MRSRFVSAAVLLLAMLVGVAPTSILSQEPDKRAEALLALMEASYSEAQSYSDSTTVIYRNPDGSERLHVDAKIWFARPENFRIDASSKAPTSKAPRREVMWSSGAAARSWASDKPVSSHPKVKILGSGMFGTYAYHVPTLLEPSYGGAQRLHQLATPAFVGEETVEGVKCYRIRGTWQGDPYELWLGTVDNLLRKVTAKYSDHQSEEIHRDVQVNQTIPSEVFRFAPENEKPAATPRPAKAK